MGVEFDGCRIVWKPSIAITTRFAVPVNSYTLSIYRLRTENDVFNLKNASFLIT